MRIALAAIVALGVSTPSLGSDCYFWNAFMDDRVTLAERSVTQVVQGGSTIQCVELDNRLAKGPFPLECTNGDSKWSATYSMFPDADGNIGALLLYADTIWYRRCEALGGVRLQPGFSLNN